MDNLGMNTYKRHRFPPDIISYAVWLHYRFDLSYSDTEDLLAECGITVSYETIRLWCIKFGATYARGGSSSLNSKPDSISGGLRLL
jgi:putative transposase